MSHEDLFNDEMSVVNGTANSHAAASRYRVSNRKIIEVSIKLESVRRTGHSFGRILQPKSDLYMIHISYTYSTSSNPGIHLLGAPQSL